MWWRGGVADRRQKPWHHIPASMGRLGQLGRFRPPRKCSSSIAPPTSLLRIVPRNPRIPSTNPTIAGSTAYSHPRTATPIEYIYRRRAHLAPLDHRQQLGCESFRHSHSVLVPSSSWPSRLLPAQSVPLILNTRAHTQPQLP